MSLSDMKLAFEPQSMFNMQEELRSLDVETFEVEDLADLGQEAANKAAGCTSCCSSCCSSCSTSSCSTCSTSCTSSS